MNGRNGKKSVTMTVQETARLLGVSPQCVRIGLERGAFSFGTVVQMKRKVYIIWRSAVEELTGKGRTDEQTSGGVKQESTAERAD